jgi:hypothetical protein
VKCAKTNPPTASQFKRGFYVKGKEKWRLSPRVSGIELRSSMNPYPVRKLRREPLRNKQKD